MIEKLKELKTEVVTQLNVLATAVLLYIVSQPSAPVEDVLGILPDSFHGVAKVVLPILWGIVVQVAIERLRKKTVEKTEDKVINTLLETGEVTVA